VLKVENRVREARISPIGGPTCDIAERVNRLKSVHGIAPRDGDRCANGPGIRPVPVLFTVD
jgi:hypothetical protein